MTGLILYRTRYGASQRYAAMLAGMLECDYKNIEDFALGDAQGLDFVVFVAGIYCGRLSGADALRMVAKLVPKIYVLIVGVSNEGQEYIDYIIRNNNEGLPAGTEYFYARGTWDISRQTSHDRLLTASLVSRLTSVPPEKRPAWSEKFLAAVNRVDDYVSPEYLLPIRDRIMEELWE